MATQRVSIMRQKSGFLDISIVQSPIAKENCGMFQLQNSSRMTPSLNQLLSIYLMSSFSVDRAANPEYQ